MDPDANYAEQLRIATEAREQDAISSDDALRLIELVLALNEWVTAGGFPPSVFAAKK